MNWSAEQQRLLQALGHDLMVHGTQWPVVGAAVVGAAVVGAASAAMSPARSIAAEAAPTRADASRLQEALRRAAGGNDISALVDDIEELRNQPALKRALWPRLRALRRSH